MVMLNEALDYNDRHFAIVPVIPGTKQAGTADGSQIKWARFQKERPNESQLRRWFGDDNQRALAVIAGEVSDSLVVRDYDDLPAYERWAAEHPDLARTLPTTRTPRPGRHVYARKCSTSRSSKRNGTPPTCAESARRSTAR